MADTISPERRSRNMASIRSKDTKPEVYLRKLLYAVRSINSMLASLNSLFAWLGWHDCRVKALKTQKQIFCPEEKELSKAEYLRLVNTAKQTGNERLNLILQTICGTGIRVSELEFITVEAAHCGEAIVSCKGKTRSVFLVRQLQKSCSAMRRSRVSFPAVSLSLAPAS